MRTRMPRLLAPIHPGEIIREEVLVPLDLSVNQLAKLLAIDTARLNEIVRGRRGITADTALRLARYLDLPRILAEAAGTLRAQDSPASEAERNRTRRAPPDPSGIKGAKEARNPPAALGRQILVHSNCSPRFPLFSSTSRFGRSELAGCRAIPVLRSGFVHHCRSPHPGALHHRH